MPATAMAHKPTKPPQRDHHAAPVAPAAPRGNLYERLLERRALRAQGNEAKSLLHRLIYVGQLHPDLADKRELAEYYERLFARLHKHHQGEAAYGLLLIYPTAVIHTVECGSESIYAILRDLRDMEQREERALLQGVKIVVVSHDLPNRLFQQWFWQVLNLPATRLEGDGGATESTVNLASEAITHVLKLGLHLLHSPKVSMRQALESVRERHPDLLLPQDTLAHLLSCHGLLTPAEFLTAYDRPFHLTLDSELVWPAPQSMTSTMEINEGQEGETLNS
ncbi:testis-expressed protein 47 isoform X1 [Lethenteron reissneri]|uniref:testis-expressed protein 47 isoform X1 n=1 Tax=Lethenteron reissneri TaxID=7753 RepID=UPI002AB69FE5|nr:testis-expressed protein 47 isoform X1 [Lethenteron reissneri]XP_061414440.1 testis-expressed protein 47 isoform X1 [Lethenteron reissneri]